METEEAHLMHSKHWDDILMISNAFDRTTVTLQKGVEMIVLLL